MKVLAFRIYTANPFGNGGERREAQLDELYQRLSVEPVFYGMTGGSLHFSQWVRALVLILRSQNRTIFRQLFRHPKRVYHYVQAWAYNVDGLRTFMAQPCSTFLYEGARDFHNPVLEEAFRHHKRVIAILHNTESLVPGVESVVTGRKAPQDFGRELSLMRRCAAVFAISHEETWLLRLFGVNAFYLPYYPTEACQAWLLNIRQARAQRKEQDTERHCLVMGTAVNAPTALGMQRLVDYCAAHPQEHIVFEVAGYGTKEAIQVPKDCTNVVLLGALTQAQLQEQMVRCSALVIQQPPTTGALTRIVEAEIAGIPVLANTDSLRNYFHIEGLYEYQSFAHLFSLLQTDLVAPAIPQAPYTDILQQLLQDEHL